ncbi:MAG: tetratricopeptide repeat protein [Candidatus Cloacimonadales bacterium]
MNRKICLILCGWLTFLALQADIFSFDKVIENYRGRRSYEQEEYEAAQENFENNALRYPDDARLHYNLGNAKFKQGNLEEAENAFQLSLRDPDFAQRSEALQNLGSIKFAEKNYPEAIKYFRDALIEDSQNAEARHNYEVTSRLLEKQQNQEQEQQQNQDDSDKDEENDENNQQSEQSEDQQSDDSEEQQQQQQQEQQDEQAADEQEQELSQREQQEKEDAEKTLKALLQKEKEEMEKQKEKAKTANPRTGRYW